MIFFLQVLEKVWRICPCGPFHALKEILFYKKRKWKIGFGVRHSLKMQGYRFPDSWAKKTLSCRLNSDDDE